MTLMDIVVDHDTRSLLIAGVIVFVAVALAILVTQRGRL